jgi:hypothetical protein
MTRRIVALLLLVMLTVQAVSGATVDVWNVDDGGAMHHCDTHEKDGSDCPCCDGSDLTGLSCAAMCSATCTTMFISLFIPQMIRSEPSALSKHWAPSPAYSPLNPPPIS